MSWRYLKGRIYGELDGAGHKYDMDDAPAPYTGNALVGETRKGNKELLTVEGALHCDLYDQKDPIPFDAIEAFIKKNI